MTQLPFTIATAQSHISPDVRANGRAIRRLMREASTAGARLIHFPKGAHSGYAKSEIKHWGDVDWPLLQAELAATAELAGQLGLWVVVGGNHRLSSPNRPHNSLYVISDRGTLTTRYDKRWCSNTEIAGWYTPGIEPCVFVIDGIRFGCALCIETQFPEVFAEYRQLGVDCVLFSSYSDSEIFGIQARAYAATYSYWVSFSVPVAMSGAYPSGCFGPDGHIVAPCDADLSMVVTNAIDLDAPEWHVPLKAARPWRALAREGEIYHTHHVSDPRSADKNSF